MSSPPTRKFHIIQPVVVNQKKRSSALQVDVEAQRLEVLEEDPAVAVDDRLREPGRAGAVEHPERVVEGDVREGERLVLALGQEVVPGVASGAPRAAAPVEVGQDDRPLEAAASRPAAPDDIEPVVVAPAVAVAVDGEQDARLDLREAVDDAAHAEVGRAARPDRAEARARVEGDGGLEDVGDVRDDAVARADPRAGERGGEAARQRRELAPRRLAERPQLGRVTDGDASRAPGRGRRARRS